MLPCCIAAGLMLDQPEFTGHGQLAGIIQLFRESMASLSTLVYVLAGQGQNHIESDNMIWEG